MHNTVKGIINDYIIIIIRKILVIFQHAYGTSHKLYNIWFCNGYYLLVYACKIISLVCMSLYFCWNIVILVKQIGSIYLLHIVMIIINYKYIYMLYVKLKTFDENKIQKNVEIFQHTLDIMERIRISLMNSKIILRIGSVKKNTIKHKWK